MEDALAGTRLLHDLRAALSELSFDAASATPRRPGVSREHYARTIRSVAEAPLPANAPDTLSARAACTDRALHLASMLFVAGAPDASWRRWMDLAARGYLACGDPTRARGAAILARNWPLAAGLPAGNIDEQAIEARAVARLMGVAASLPDADADLDDYHRACIDLVRSIPASDHAATEQALATLCDFWVEMAVYMHDPHPDRYPQFEPAACALAALAHRSGYQPSADFDEDYRLFLLPGLSD